MQEILAFAPVVCLIAYAVLTRQMAQAMVVAGVLAMAILHGANFLSGTIDSLYSVLADSSYQFVLLIMVCFGGMIALLQKSGALQGFRDSLLRVAAVPVGSVRPKGGELQQPPTSHHPNGAVGCPGQHQLMAGKEGRRARRRAGDGDVVVVHRPPEQTVPDTAAHQPALLAGRLQPGKHRQHLRRQPVSGHRLTPPGGRGRPGPPCRSAPLPRTSAAPRGRRSPPGG